MDDFNDVNVILMYCGLWMLASGAFVYSYNRIKALTDLNNIVVIVPEIEEVKMTEEEIKYITDDVFVDFFENEYIVIN